MSKIKFYFILLIAAVVTVSSCNKNDDNEDVTPPKPFAEQYPIDIAAIEDYLNTHYIKEVVNKPGQPEDQDVIIEKITDVNDPAQKKLMSYLDSPTLPRLSSREVYQNGFNYKFYYLVIREGVKGATGIGGESPCNLDGVFAGYQLSLLDGTMVETSNNPQALFNLDGTDHDGGNGVIRGWSEGFPQFKTGWVSSNSDGTIRNNDFGVGMMFLPSGLGYYNQPQASIPAYSPLVFSIKLYALKRYDHERNGITGQSDPDGILTYQEDLDGDGYIRITSQLPDGAVNPDDTDKDGIPDCFDFDDDGDGYATRGEIKDAHGKNYPFESIPDCSGNTTDPKRVKRYLDNKCHYVNQ